MRYTIAIASAIMASIPALAPAAVSGEWRLTLTRDSTTVTTVTGATQDQVWANCQAQIPTSATAATTYRCQGLMYAATVTPDAPANRVPTISGTPPSSVVAGQPYSFTPTAADADGDALTFSIQNKPSWAGFNTSTGALTGTPTVANTTYSNIRITVSDGKSSASTNAFSITVTAAPPPPSGPTLTYSATPGGTYAALAGATISGSINVRLSDCSTGPWTFSVDGSTVNTERACPYALVDDNQLYDTRTLSNGTHTVSAVGQSTVTATFTVNNGAPPLTGSAMLNWHAPTKNTDGSTLINLAGFRILYGPSPSALTQSIDIANPGVATYIVQNLTGGPWYFTVRGYNASGVESGNSNVGSKTIQ
jgi:Putative Ig domain